MVRVPWQMRALRTATLEATAVFLDYLSISIRERVMDEALESDVDEMFARAREAEDAADPCAVTPIRSVALRKSMANHPAGGSQE